MAHARMRAFSNKLSAQRAPPACEQKNGGAMFKKIMVPVDLKHIDRLGKALDVAATLAKDTGAELIYVAVAASAPTEFSHTPQEYAAKLAEFARQSGEEHGVETHSKAYISHDPTADLDATLLKATHELWVDLVVMASHIPGVVDSFWPSNGGMIASHADISVFIVR
jgi:nucleotide-binding universal stress UspA family protein